MHQNIKSRQFYLLIIVAMNTILLLAQCTNTSKSNTNKPKVIRIGYLIGHIPPIINRQLGWFDQEFKKDNIKFEYVKLASGPPLVEAFIANRVDFVTVGDQPALVGWAKGANIKVVGNAMGGYVMALIVQNESPIKTFKELKGKKIGITIGSDLQHLLYLHLLKDGLTEKDVHLVNLSFADCVHALATRDIDATILSEPFVSLAEITKAGKIIIRSDSLKYATLPIVATTTFINSYPDIVVRLLKLYNKAIVWAHQNPDEAADILLKEENMLPKDVAVRLIKKHTNYPYIDKKTIAAFLETYKFLRARGIITKDLDFNTYYDTTFEKRAGINLDN